MKHVKQITAPASALADLDFRGFFRFWVDELQNSIAAWKAYVAVPGLTDADDPTDFFED